MTQLFILLASFLSGTSYSLIAPVLPPRYEKEGVSVETVGFIFAIFSLSEVLVGPLIGMAMERFKPINFMVLGLTIMSICYAGFGLIDRAEGPF